MYEAMLEEFEQFKADMENGETFCKYMVEDDYEDEYSHNEIDEYMEKFEEKAREYLHEHIPGKYIVSGGWCVFVMTEEEAKKRNMHMYEEWLVR